MYNQETLEHFEMISGFAKGAENIQLSYTYFKLPKSRATLVYTHSYGSCKYEGTFLLPYCYQRKLNLLVYDSRSHGKTIGGKITFGFKEKIDLQKILTKMKLEFHV